MGRVFAFEREPTRTERAVEVLATGLEGDRPFAVLDDTILYPEGGGQPADHGWLGEVAVVDVQKRDAEIRHYTERPVSRGVLHLRLDWARRFDHMQQHTGQHLLTAVAQDRFGWETTAFHLNPDVCDIELAVPRIASADLRRLEAAVAEEIRAVRPVSARRVSPEAYAAEQVRSRGLPEGHTGDIRLVEIAGLDLNTCGGTHLRSTAELEALALLGSEPHLGGTRLFFVAGGRVRARLAAHEARSHALRGLLGVPDADLAAAVEGRLAQLQAAERRARHLEEALAASLAEALAARPGRLVEHHAQGQDAGFLGKVARGTLGLDSGKVLLLTGEKAGQGFFVVAADPGSGLDVAGLGRAVAEALEGRGGGNAPVFQGKAGRLEGRAEAVARLQQALA